MRLIEQVGLILLLLGFVHLALTIQPENCPASCNCTKVKNGPYFKVRCMDRIDSLQKLDLIRLAPQIAQLDVSKNIIEDVGVGYFTTFSNLKRLDLSSNRITVLHDLAFEGLRNLDVLKLSNNNLSHIGKEVLHHTPSLKKLDISNNSLECNCSLTWLDWVRNHSVKISPMAKCSGPTEVKGLSLVQWYDKSISLCSSHSPSLDILKLQPQQDQVVFEGDPLRLQCMASLSGLDGPSISWFWGKQDPSVAFKDVRLDTLHLPRNDALQSSLIIDHLTSSHSGQWNCLLLSGQANHSRTVSVIVISEETRYCPQTVSNNNKGLYTWPRTVTGFTAELPCQAADFINTHKPHAYHECGTDGKWLLLNTSLCPYSSETTRLLQDFSRMNLSEEHGPAIIESAQRLLNLSTGPPFLTDKMDAIFLARAINNYLKFLPVEKEVGSLLMDMVSCAIQMPRNVLRAAQLEDHACTRLVRSVETITQFSSSMQTHKANLAVEEFRVTHESFLGITCVWYSVLEDAETIPSYPNPSRILCSQDNNTGFLSKSERVIEASVQVPQSLFYQLKMQNMPVLPTHQLLISMYENSHLFPHVRSNDSNDRWDVTSSVIGAKLVGLNVKNLAEPLKIVVRAPAVREASGWARPVWWDDELNGGAGGWSEQGCTPRETLHGKLIFYCDRLGYFGLLQKMSLEFERRIPRSIWELSHPAVYIGSAILIVSLITAIVTYVVAGPHIMMPKRTKHALINTWIALSLLSFMFSVGVHQTDDLDLCQSVGMILHYLTLCTLLWMAVTVNNMRKSLRKKHPLEMGSEDDLPASTTPPPKPLLGLYLVGWGIGLMVVGVSGAVNLKQYRYLVQDEYCFLVPNSALGAVLVPCAAVIIYLFVCVLLVRCDLAQRQGDTNAQLSDGTQGTENVDLELLDCTVPARPGIGSMSVASSVSSEVEDAEHTPATQLRAAMIVLLLFISLWAAGALSTASQLHAILPHAQLIFGTLYAITAFLLGAFILFFHCFARSDVRPCWRIVRCRGRNISDTHTCELPQATSGTGDKVLSETQTSEKIANVGKSIPTQVNVAVSNHLSSSTSINSNKSHNLRAAVELNKSVGNASPDSHQGPPKATNMNLMPMYQQFPSVVDADIFYNPRQSDMARKFFRKQKRHAMCPPPTHLETSRRLDGECNQSDMESTIRDSLKGSGSKVSNTNIHVENHVDECPSNHTHNCNILTNQDHESANQERWVIGADGAPNVNNDGTEREKLPNGATVPSRIVERSSSRRRRSRGSRDSSVSHSRAREKFHNHVQNGTVSSVSSVRSRDVEMEGDVMRVSVMENTPHIPSMPRTSSYPWDNSSVISGVSCSVDRVSENENDFRSISRASRRSNRSLSSRKRYRRNDPVSLRSHPTSLASSVVSLQNKDAFIESCNRSSEVASNHGCEDAAAAASKKETCV